MIVTVPFGWQAEESMQASMAIGHLRDAPPSR